MRWNSTGTVLQNSLTCTLCMRKYIALLSLLKGCMYVCIFGFKGASTSQVIGAHSEMMMDDYDGQMIFGDLVGVNPPDIRLTGEEKPQKNLTQETCPDWGSNPGQLHDKRACYHLFHSGGPEGLYRERFPNRHHLSRQVFISLDRQIWETS